MTVSVMLEGAGRPEGWEDRMRDVRSCVRQCVSCASGVQVWGESVKVSGTGCECVCVGEDMWIVPPRLEE